MGHHDEWNREGDEKQIGHYVTGPHCDQVGIAEATFWTWVRYNLPVMVEGLAFSQSSNNHCQQCRCQEVVDEFEEYSEGSSPDLACHSFEELAYCELGYPDAIRMGTVRADPLETPGEKRDNLQDSIEDARHKNEFTANDSMIDVFSRQAHGLGIIGTPD